jgi:broad specificity phosphatase PhoE
MGNLTDDYSTPAHDRLSRLGWEQAKRLAERLAGHSFDVIYCSPLRRTRETITPYLRQTGRVAEVWPELVEGCWQEEREALPPDRAAPLRPFALDEALRERFVPCTDPTYWAPENEVYCECLARIERVSARLRARHAGRPESVLVVGHEYAGGRLLEMLLGIEPLGRLYHANAGMSRLVQGADGAFIARFVNRL